MSDLQKMLYLLNEYVEMPYDPNLIDKMMYLLNEPSEQLPEAIMMDDIRPTLIVDGQPMDVVAENVQSPEAAPEMPEKIMGDEPMMKPTYNTNCDDPANQDIVADFITINGYDNHAYFEGRHGSPSKYGKNNVTKKCITGNDFK